MISFGVYELLPSGRVLLRETYTSRRLADRACYLLNIDLEEENHHYVEKVEVK